MAYADWDVVAFEQPTAAKWNILGDNDAALRDGSGVLWNNNQAISANNSSGVARQVVKRNASNNLELGDTTQAGLLQLNETWDSDVQPTARVKRAGVQTLANATFTKVQFDSEEWDVGGLHDNSTNNTRFTITKPGIYLFGGTISFTANATGIRDIRWAKNGSDLLYGSNRGDVVINSAKRITGHIIESMAANDYIELQGYQTSGGDLTITADSYMWCFKLA